MRIHNLEKDFFNRITRSKSLFVTKMTDRLGLQAPPQVASISGQRLNEGTTSMGQILSKLSDIDKALDELDKSVVSSKAIAEENRLNIGKLSKLSDIDKALDEFDKSLVSYKAIAEEYSLNIGTMNNKLSNVIKAICIVGGSACAVYLSILIARKIDSSYSSLVSELIEDIQFSSLQSVNSVFVIGRLSEILEGTGQPTKFPYPF